LSTRRTREVQCWVWVGLLGLVLGCGQSIGRGPVNLHPDAGGGDSGVVLPEDAGPVPDAGVALDGGAVLDAGTDGGVTMGERIQLPPAGRVYHGVFPAGSSQPDSDSSLQALDEYQSAVGRPLAWVYFSNEWFQSKAFPRVTSEAIRARGAVPFIRLHMRSQRRQLLSDPLYTLDNIIAGQFDDDLRTWADGAKAFGTALVVQYGTEVNGDWNPWSPAWSANGDLVLGAEKFRNAFRHIVEVMRAEGANNITWALHINGENWPAYQNSAGFYYPGDDVVDWIGFSIYQNYGVGDPLCRDMGALLKARADELGDAAKKKPLFIFELGTSMTSLQCDPGGWVRRTLTDLLDGRWPELRGFSWWDETTADRSIVMRVPDTPTLRQPFHDVLNGSLGSNLVDRPIVK